MTCSFHVSLLFDLSIKLLSELMIFSSALMNSRFAVDFDLREREKFHFSIFDLRHSHLWSYWVEWELVLIIWLCSITCWSIWYIIFFDKLLSSMHSIIIFILFFANFMHACIICVDLTQLCCRIWIFNIFAKLLSFALFYDILNVILIIISWLNDFL